MKKLFSLLFLSLIIGSVFATPITQKQAVEAAQKYYNFRADGVRGLNVESVYANSHKGLTTYFIVNFEEGGFVIISADDRVKPILAYSLTGQFEQNITNAEVAWWMENYSKQIEYIVVNDMDNLETKKMWNNIFDENLTKAGKAVTPLLTTNWNQSGNYNDYCPGGSVPNGCVSVAMAQIMNYHEYPVTGKSWHQYTHPTYGVQTAYFDEREFAWAEMPNNDGGDAVSWLTYQCGVSVDMDYAQDGSGAQSQDAAIALANYFAYDQSLDYVNKEEYTDVEWIDLLKNELDNSRPVYYSGSSEASGGHAFVFDGYDDSDAFHVNWGWGGSANAYFAVGSLNPSGLDFNDYNSAIIGIQPPVNKEEAFYFVRKFTDFSNLSEYPGYISAVNESVAWATGRDGSGGSADFRDYTRTTDGGATWTAKSVTNLGGTAFSMIQGLSSDIAYIAMYGSGTDNHILRTTDGGENWESILNGAGASSFFNVVHFFNENDGFVQGDPEGGEYELYTTTDGGDSWTRVDGADIPDPEDASEYGIVGFYTAIGDVIWYTTNNGYVYKSLDKGYTWNKYQILVGTATNIEIEFDDGGLNGLAVNTAGTPVTFYSTTDGGETWTEITPAGDVYGSGISAVPGEANTFMAVGSDYETPAMGVSKSTDGGLTWTNIAEYYENFQFISIDMVSADKGFAGTFGGEWSDGMLVYGEPSAELLAGFNTSDSEGTDSLFCINTAITFTNNSTGFVESYSWDFGTDATPATATGVGPHTVEYSSGGSKNVTLTITDDVPNENIYETNIIVAETTPSNIDVIEGPEHVVIPSFQTYSVTAQENTYFEWSTTSMFWELEETNSNEIEVEFSGFNMGAQDIEVFAFNGCGQSEVATLAVDHDFVGINENNSKIKIYPNPAQNFVNIENAQNSSINIYNAIGALVYTVNSKNETTKIDVSSFDAGIYFLEISNQKETVKQTITIVK